LEISVKRKTREEVLMKKPNPFLFLTLALLLPGMAAAQTYSAALLGGAAEVPTGDPDGTGLAVVTISGSNVQFFIGVTKIAAPTAAHIHRGAPGVAGPIVVGFTVSFAAGSTSGSVNVTDQALLDEIRANPAGFYVNVHNADFPGGAVRGQLASAQAWSSVLLGGAVEVPPGDPDGSGFTTVAISGSAVQFFMSVSNIAAPTASHIHEGGSGVAAPVVIGFPAGIFADGTASGSVTVTDQGLLDRIRVNPTGFYVNVHTGDFPGGAVRGQVGTTLRLLAGRFDVTVFARDLPQRTDRTSEGQAIPQNDLFGYHSLPGLTSNPDNPEMFVKVLDGRVITGKFWVFFNGLTDLDVTVTVKDNATGAVKTYHKEGGSACGGFDTDAF
jgi:hypothetical protein